MAVMMKKTDISTLRKDFPILQREVHGKSLVYLDNGATSQKPQPVIDAILSYYSRFNSNVHRGVHTLSQEATVAFEEVRLQMQQFLNARHAEEVIFTSGTTGGINLVSNTFGRSRLQEGDEVVITTMEHHSNIVPWQMICNERKAVLKVAPINDKGELIWEEFEKLLTERTRLVSVVHVSNSLGTINPVKKIIEAAHAKGIEVLVDGAQAVPHMPVDVQQLDCDYYVFSLHKMFGPTGIGVLYGKKELLEELPPFLGGGDMIKEVTFEKTTYNELPHKFEAGTPNIADVIATGAALEYIAKLDWEAIAAHEQELLDYAHTELGKVEGVRFIGTADNKASVVSFVVKGFHAYDIGVLIDKMGIAVRTGHHCTQPLMRRFGIEGTIRASFAFYNTKAEVDLLVTALRKAIKMLS